jgi:hypothetical protein
MGKFGNGKGCTKLVVRGGVCVERGARVKSLRVMRDASVKSKNGTEVTTTIAVNVGAVTKDYIFLRHQTKQHCNHQLNLILNNPNLII